MGKKETHHIKSPQKQDLESLNKVAYETVLELETPLGINASGKGDPFAAFFGRDSAITGLKLLRVYKKKPDAAYPRIVRKILKTASRLQGKEINLASGEKPGKIIHEYREADYSHLVNRERPWYIYPDKTLRNYDTTDSTPLFLILAAEFYNFTKDEVFLQDILPTVKKAFDYLKKFGHKGGKRLFLEYQLHRPEPYGGLVNQGWMDSADSIRIYGEPPKEPIALVEAQGYYFKALKFWAVIYEKIDHDISRELEKRASELDKEFDKVFLNRSEGLYYFDQAIFSQKAEIIEVRSNPGHCLWAAVQTDGKFKSIINDEYIPNVVARLMMPDMFEPGAGIRTLSTKSKFFGPCSYHNGSIWPFDNGLIAEGFENFGFYKEAEQIKKAVLNAISYFGMPIELYCVENDGKINEYISKHGHRGARKQAWTAATILDFTT